MADAIVSAAAGRLVGLIEEQARYHINLVRGAEEEVHTLVEELNKIRYVLDDAEDRRLKDKNINYWLSKLEHTSYDMEDVLDQWNHAILKLEMEQPAADSPKQKVWSFIPSSACLCFKKVVVRHEIAAKILNVKAQLDGIFKEKDRYNFMVSQRSPGQPSPKSRRDPSTSFTVVEEVHGRALDSDTLVTKLTSDGGSIQVVSIVGVGGLGKTTIAQLVYNHTRLEKHFDLRIWVCVSDPFDLAAIAKGIIESAQRGDSPSTNNLETLWQCVTGIISGRKFLLVLDDVWTEEYGKWERLESYLRCGGEGSKVLVTTRKTKVAKIMGTMEEDIHYPEMLSVEDCWLLMHRIACLGRDEVEFEDIGKEIAKKCNGLPLAARTLGSLLRNKDKLEEWMAVLNSDVWEMKEAEVELFPHLLLTYNELSPILKRCFSYCAVYPKDSKINVRELIGNWISLGYLVNDSSDIEDRGQEYFDILVMHSLFQVIYEDKSSGEKNCKMHDIVHDFAQFLRKSNRVGATRTNNCTICLDCDPSQISTVNESRILFWNDKESPPNLCDCLSSLRVLSLSRCNLQRIPHIMENFIHLRLLNLFGNTLSCDDLKIIFKLYNLKTLNLGSCNLKDIPSEIGNLIHLRYLNLTLNTSLEKLPREIEKLIQLRNLDLWESVSLNELPKEIGSLINLTHLNLSRNESLKKLPKEIGNLIHLTRLNLSWNNSLMEVSREIGHLINLRYLDLCCNDSLTELPTEIGNLIHLTDLDLSWNTSLRELPKEIGNLIHLRDLNLSGNGSLKELPKEIGNLIHLRHLDLSHNKSLKELPREIGNLIHLRHLNLYWNQSLEKLPDTICGLKELRILNVAQCENLIVGLEVLAQLTCFDKSIRLSIRLDGDNDLKSLVEYARKAELWNRIEIEDLEIRFEDEMDEKMESSSSCNSSSRVMEDVMDALKPHSYLNELSISKYKGSILPGWLLSPINGLMKITLVECHYLKALPSLGKLPFLENIQITQMEALEIVGREFLGFHECSSDTTIISFPKLRVLGIYSCGKWEEWEDITAEEEASADCSIMPCLWCLKIENCNGLTTLPRRLLRKLSSLEWLVITGSTQLKQCYGNKDGSDWKSISQNNPHLQLIY